MWSRGRHTSNKHITGRRRAFFLSIGTISASGLGVWPPSQNEEYLPELTMQGLLAHKTTLALITLANHFVLMRGYYKQMNHEPFGCVRRLMANFMRCKQQELTTWSLARTICMGAQITSLATCWSFASFTGTLCGVFSLCGHACLHTANG